jgi:hypothetical protein
MIVASIIAFSILIGIVILAIATSKFLNDIDNDDENLFI